MPSKPSKEAIAQVLKLTNAIALAAYKHLGLRNPAVLATVGHSVAEQFSKVSEENAGKVNSLDPKLPFNKGLAEELSLAAMLKPSTPALRPS